MEKTDAERRAQRWRQADVIPAQYPCGHARDSQFDDAVLSCAPVHLPDSPNY